MDLDGLFATSTEVGRLEKLEIKLKSAKIKGVKHCIKCGYCCNRRSCVPTPKELTKIAKFLKLKPKKCINTYFAIDRSSFGYNYIIKPVSSNIMDLAGKFIPSSRTFNEGRCVFLSKHNLCKIYPVRPKSAKICKCWEEEQIEYDVNGFWEENKLKTIFGIDGEKLENESEREEEDD